MTLHERVTQLYTALFHHIPDLEQKDDARGVYPLAGRAARDGARVQTGRRTACRRRPAGALG